MLAVLVDHELAIICAIISFTVELIRILAVSFITSLPELRKLRIERQKIVEALSLIKSPQLEFVKASKLERDEIKISKKIEILQIDHTPLVNKCKKYAITIRIVLYILFGIVLHLALEGNDVVLLMQSKLTWPIPLGYDFMPINAVAFLIFTAIAWRQILRTFIVLVYRRKEGLP